MSSLPKTESSHLVRPGLMDGYGHYLKSSKKMPPHKAAMYVNLVRKFQNHLGKPYVDIKQLDVKLYLIFLGEKACLKEGSLYLNLAAIKKFYEYLSSVGVVGANPCDGVSIKGWHKCRLDRRMSGL